MLSSVELKELGIQKLGADAFTEFSGPVTRAPTSEELRGLMSYPRSALLGALGGGALGAITGALTRKNLLQLALLGSTAGSLGGIVRRYDVAADPPGLSPVYTVPASLRLGALAGLISGPLLSSLLRVSPVSGIATSIASGAAGSVLAGPVV